MTMIIKIKGIKSKFMVVRQNPPVEPASVASLAPFSNSPFSKSPKQGWVPLLVYIL